MGRSHFQFSFVLAKLFDYVQKWGYWADLIRYYSPNEVDEDTDVRLMKSPFTENYCSQDIRRSHPDWRGCYKEPCCVTKNAMAAKKQAEAAMTNPCQIAVANFIFSAAWKTTPTV